MMSKKNEGEVMEGKEKSKVEVKNNEERLNIINSVCIVIENAIHPNYKLSEVYSVLQALKTLES